MGSNMCYWILTEKGDVVADTTVQHVTSEDAATLRSKNKLRNLMMLKR